MSNLEKLKRLLHDIESKSIFEISGFEGTIERILKDIFEDDNEFVVKSKNIAQGWAVVTKYHISCMDGNIDQSLSSGKKEMYIELINNAIYYAETYLDDTKETIGADTVENKKIFIVHGHDGELKFNVSNWLQYIGLNPIILHLQANKGITSIMEKIEQNSDVSCAIILMTADDLGKAKSDEKLNPRARQNVVFEAGYFIGKLDRSHVIMLYDKGLETPGDLSGCVYILADEYGGWKEAVRAELNSMGIEYTN